MNPPTLHNITLTAAALLTSFALTAHGGSAKVSSILQTYGSSRSANPIHRLLFPESTYVIDDHTAEDAVGFGNGTQNYEALWFNQFAVIPGQTTIASVSVVWGTPNFLDPNINGTPVTIAIWSDPNGDGNPSDAVLLGSTDGFMLNAGTDSLVTYPFSPTIALPAGATSFFVGDVTPRNNGPLHGYQGIDENSPHHVSWLAGMGDGSPADINNIGNNSLVAIIDTFGISGNWLIRADAGDGSENITLTANIRRQHGKRFVALSWSPADGGSVNVTRNGNLVATAENDGSGQDSIEGHTGVVIYQVCKTDGSGCSNQVMLRVSPPID